jgi:putative phosphoesterase
MRVALISDLHANELALNAVLDDVRRNGVDQIVCLGDVATLGPRPVRVVATLRELGCPCILGNHDEFLLDPPLLRTYNEAPFMTEAVAWCRDELAGDDLEFVRSFRRTLELDLGGGATLLLFHGTPQSHMTNLLATTPPDELDAMLSGHRATVMAGGHTHIQMMRQHRGTLIVNPGSVGLAFREFVNGGPPTLLPHAEYATVEADRGGAVHVALHRVPLDPSALRRQAAESELPMRGMLVQQYS